MPCCGVRHNICLLFNIKQYFSATNTSFYLCNFVYFLGEEPAAIQSSGANSIFSTLHVKTIYNPSMYILLSKIYLQLSLLMFLVSISQKVYLFIQMSLPINKSLMHTTTMTPTLNENLHLSEQKRNGDAIRILLRSKSRKTSLQNDTTAITFHSSSNSTKSS